MIIDTECYVALYMIATKVIDTPTSLGYCYCIDSGCTFFFFCWSLYIYEALCYKTVPFTPL